MTMQMRTRVLIVLVALGVASVAVARADRSEEPPLRRSFSLFPIEVGEWRGYQRQPLTDRVLEVLKLDDYVTRVYVNKEQAAVDLYIGYWKSQAQGGAIHSPQNCLPGAGWGPVSQRMLTFPDPRGGQGAPPLSVNRYVIQKGLERQLVLYWYQSRGRIVGSEYWSKIYLVLDAARYNRTDAALVRLIVPFEGDSPAVEARAERQILDFANVLLPILGDFIPN